MKIRQDKGIIMKWIGVVGLLLVIAFSIFGVLIEKKPEVIYTNYASFLEYAKNSKVGEVTLSNSPKMQFKLKGDSARYETDNPRSLTIKEDLLKLGVPVTEGNYVSPGYIIQTLLGLVFLTAVILISYKAFAKNNAIKGGVAGFSVENKAIGSVNQTYFDDVAGNEEAKDSVNDIVDFIKTPGKYSKYGARMPRGIIFYGPPGTGKTLMAKAIAGEAGVPFYAVSGSDFVQMYVGVGAGRIRDLFKKARESKRAVVFIDEIDALGKKRSGVAAGGNDERDQALNALLTEMSGFSSTDGVVVIAATNRIDTLDEALLRPGRFDRQVEIGLPDMKGRLSILKLHAGNKPLSDEICLESIAKQTVYFSGAMLENLLNEAAISAAKNETEKITKKDVETAYYTVIAGSEKKDRSGIKERDRRITAFHESGHALAAKIVSPENTVSKVTIIPGTKGSGGFCINIPPDKMYYTKKELEAQVIVNLAGRVAEELVFGADNITTGACNDLEKASQIVTDYITKYGMANNGENLSNGVKFVYSKKNGGENAVFEEYKAQMERLYNEAKKLIKLNMPKLTEIAEALLENDTLNENEIDDILKIKPWACSPNPPYFSLAQNKFLKEKKQKNFNSKPLRGLHRSFER